MAVVAAAFLLSGCAPAPDTSESARQAESFPGVYAQSIEWGACDDEYSIDAEKRAIFEARGADTSTFRCAMIEAPLDWNDPKNHTTIELAVTHIPATGEGEAIGTLFGNPGGPGGSGLQYTYGMASTKDFDAVHEQYDLIGFDPRGIERSTPIECDDRSDVVEIAIAMCAKEQPLALSMGTSQVARDMELLRVLMDEDKLDYLGYSYGTILGATYTTLFPEKVGRFVLDSAPDVTWASPTGNFTQAVSMINEIVAMLESCPEREGVTSCPVTNESEFSELLDGLSEEPLVASDGSQVGGGTVYGYLSKGLYGRDAGRTDALDTLAGALAGDQTQIDQIVAALADGGASVGFGGQLVACHSFPNDPDINGFIDVAESTEVPQLLGGPEATDDMLAQFVNLGCDALPNSGDDITDKFTAPKNTPIVVIGITGDHATPYANGRALAAQLGNTRFVTLEGHGHAASFTERSTCIDDVTTAFLLEGTLPNDGLTCRTN